MHVLLVSSFFFGMCTRAHSVGVGVCKSEDTFLPPMSQESDVSHQPCKARTFTCWTLWFALVVVWLFLLCF